MTKVSGLIIAKVGAGRRLGYSAFGANDFESLHLVIPRLQFPTANSRSLGQEIKPSFTAVTVTTREAIFVD